MSLRRAIRRDRTLLENVAALASMASAAGSGMSDIAALLEAEIAEIKSANRTEGERAKALDEILQRFWPDGTSMARRASQLARDLHRFRRAGQARGATGYESALAKITSLFDQTPSARTILRIRNRKSD